MLDDVKQGNDPERSGRRLGDKTQAVACRRGIVTVTRVETDDAERRITVDELVGEPSIPGAGIKQLGRATIDDVPQDAGEELRSHDFPRMAHERVVLWSLAQIHRAIDSARLRSAESDVLTSGPVLGSTALASRPTTTAPVPKRSPRNRVSPELLWVPLGLAAFAAAVYGAHITSGGFWFDDWRVELVSLHTGLFGMYHGLVNAGLNPRPLLALSLGLVHKTFGLHTKEYLVFAVVVSLLAACALYALLAELRLPLGLRLGAAVLFLVFPWADGGELWPEAAQNQIAVALVLFGGWCGLRARPARWGYAVASAAAYAAAVLQYEEIAALVVVIALIQLLRYRTRWGILVAGIGVGAAAAAALSVLASGTPSEQPDAAGMIHHAGTIAQQSWQLLGSALMPADSLWRVGSVAAALLVLVSVVLVVRLGAADPHRVALRGGLVLVGVGIVAIAAGYAAIVPASDWYVPLQPGQGTRTNTAAAVGWVILVVGLAWLLAEVMRTAAERRNVRLPAATVLGVVGLLTVLWVARVTSDARDWSTAAEIQQQVLSLTKAGVPTAPPGTTFVVFGAPRATSAEVPVFLEPEDLTAALQIIYRRAVAGWPILGTTQVVCGASGPQTVGGWIPPQTGATYGHTFFIDFPDGTVEPVPNRAACQRVLPSLHPGPITEY